MEIKQNPFSLYDFLGYFVPGTIFVLGAIVIYMPTLSTKTFLEVLALDQAGFYLPFILLAYLTGHILSFVSGQTLENYSKWNVGYPSEFLLNYPYPSYWNTKGKGFQIERLTIRFLVLLFLLPITVWDQILGKKMRLKELLYARPLDQSLINIVKAKFNKLIKDRSGLTVRLKSKNEADYFIFAYHYAVEKAQYHLPKMQNYVALYGFARTITIVMVFWFWEELAVSIYRPCGNVSITLLALSLLSFISFLNFMKFYRRFSVEVMMAITAIM